MTIHMKLLREWLKYRPKRPSTQSYCKNCKFCKIIKFSKYGVLITYLSLWSQFFFCFALSPVVSEITTVFVKMAKSPILANFFGVWFSYILSPLWSHILVCFALYPAIFENWILFKKWQNQLFWQILQNYKIFKVWCSYILGPLWSQIFIHFAPSRAVSEIACFGKI